ncbi:MAG TPA: WYL domain-containing protein [Longimicrobiales bacterium]|nr:WYL domain-containing protein [Longimicrobiales bacterium]
MSDRITKTQRWLDLLAYLVGRRLPVAVDELMERVPAYADKWRHGDDTARASVRRMFERDKDELRQLGIPIETVSYDIRGAPGEEVLGYRLARRDFYLPYLKVVAGDVPEPADEGLTAEDRARLDAARDRARGGSDPARIREVEIEASDAEDAIQALREVAELPAFPYAREARSALRKLGFDLGGAMSAPTPAPAPAPAAAPSFFTADASTAAVADRLRTLADALFAKKTVSFAYHGIQRGETTDREVQPYGLLFQHSRWYLVAFDPMREGMRVFRVDRMDRVERNTQRPNTPDYEIPADFRLAEYAQKEAWELGDANTAPVRALVRFEFPRSLWAERNGHGERVEEHDDGSDVRVFYVAQPDPFLRWILSMSGEAMIVSPAELADDLRAMAREVAKAHGAPA